MVWYVTGRSHAIGLSAAAAGLYVGHCNLCYVPSGGEWCRHTHTHTPHSPIFRVPATNRAYVQGIKYYRYCPRFANFEALFDRPTRKHCCQKDVKENSRWDLPIFVGICVNLKPAFFRAGSGDTAPLFCFSHSHLAVVRRFLCPKLRSTPPPPPI